jgi:hypothetical protein
MTWRRDRKKKMQRREGRKEAAGATRGFCLAKKGSRKGRC